MDVRAGGLWWFLCVYNYIYLILGGFTLNVSHSRTTLKTRVKNRSKTVRAYRKASCCCFVLTQFQYATCAHARILLTHNNERDTIIVCI